MIHHACAYPKEIDNFILIVASRDITQPLMHLLKCYDLA